MDIFQVLEGFAKPVILLQFKARVKLKPDRMTIREDFNFTITQKFDKRTVLKSLLL